MAGGIVSLTKNEQQCSNFARERFAAVKVAKQGRRGDLGGEFGFDQRCADRDRRGEHDKTHTICSDYRGRGHGDAG